MAKARPSRPRPLTLRFLTGRAHAQSKKLTKTASFSPRHLKRVEVIGEQPGGLFSTLSL
ncbi:alpha-galactosidase [Lacticaseibacillus rhamnosus]|nr:alpha-galactosidase [Lacticaseibacillus rhamnosus]MCT3180691.1 alpha-galactosidase [Lacticaseibacillus rhamnosus]